MRIVRKDADALNTTIELTIEPVDYANEFETRLKKLKSQAQIKGFRKGMTPVPMLKKMYGKSVFSDIINETIQKELFDYLDNEKLNYLGQPLPDKDENTIIDLDINNLNKEYTFKFDLGLVKKIEITGVSETDTYNLYNVEIPENIVNDEILNIRKQYGKQQLIEDGITEDDMVKMEASELDGDTIKNDGFAASFSILVNLIPDTDLKSTFLSKKVGDILDVDVYKLEDKSREHIDKYMLRKAENIETSDMFRAEITEVSRIIPAEMNQEFFDNLYNEAVTDEESFRKAVHDDIKRHYDIQAQNFMNRDIMDAILENNQVELPVAFLKRYLKESNDNISVEQIDEEFDVFAKNMQWTLIKGQLVKDMEIQVSEHEIRGHFQQSVVSYLYKYGNLDSRFIDSTVDRLMEDKDQVQKVYDELLADKLFNRIDLTVQKNMVDISYDDFNQKVKELNNRLNNLQ